MTEKSTECEGEVKSPNEAGTTTYEQMESLLGRATIMQSQTCIATTSGTVKLQPLKIDRFLYTLSALGNSSASLCLRPQIMDVRVPVKIECPGGHPKRPTLVTEARTVF